MAMAGSGFISLVWFGLQMWCSGSSAGQGELNQ